MSAAGAKRPKKRISPASLASLAPPEFIEPMKAKPGERAPVGADWLYELKYDGYRFLALKHGTDVRLVSRNANELTTRFPSVAKAIAALSCATATLDGELVVPDEAGRPSFQLIQNADEHTAAHAFAFDLITLDGDDLRARPLIERRARLAELLPKESPILHLSAELEGDPDLMLAQIAERGLEGLIAKKRSAEYETGRRSGSWLKFKCLREQEFVVGGFTPPKGTRGSFGALVVGYYHDGKLLFAGRVGTGFSERILRDLHGQLLAIQQPKCPFADLPRPRSSRWAQPITRAEMARCTWVKPELVCQVRFTEWTEDGSLRHPAFLGMRLDKPAAEVVRET